MDASSVLFYILSALVVVSALSVILSRNPIYSALSLVITMMSLAFVFFLLKAMFIAGVQLIVYAGAVMVLFVMVLMLFDLKKEDEVFTRGSFSKFLKISAVGWFCGLVVGGVYMSMGMTLQSPTGIEDETRVKALSMTLFTEYVFAFEALGLLLLLIAIGVVAISRIKGGTHAQS